jgi:3-deoxy-manno-octulosonate cytidylyltransferase (CMP-KDO synthetase)
LQLDPESVIVNIQGDEPALEAAMLDQLLEPFSGPQIQVTTLARRIDAREAQNPNQVKVVLASDRRALYFSRAVVPFQREASTSCLLGHIGIYAFRMQTLQRFVSLDQSALEVAEGLEQLRLIDNHIPIHVVETEHRSLGVDRPEDIPTVSAIIEAKRAASG